MVHDLFVIKKIYILALFKITQLFSEAFWSPLQITII